MAGRAGVEEKVRECFSVWMARFVSRALNILKGRGAPIGVDAGGGRE